jgi:hypothetical protein
MVADEDRQHWNVECFLVLREAAGRRDDAGAGVPDKQVHEVRNVMLAHDCLLCNCICSIRQQLT